MRPPSQATSRTPTERIVPLRIRILIVVRKRRPWGARVGRLHHACRGALAAGGLSHAGGRVATVGWGAAGGGGVRGARGWRKEEDLDG